MTLHAEAFVTLCAVDVGAGAVYSDVQSMCVVTVIVDAAYADAACVVDVCCYCCS